MGEFDYMSLLNEESTKEQYTSYIEQHKSNVRKGADWIIENLPELLVELGVTKEALLDRAEEHDASKYSPEEFDAYAEFFYGKEKTEKVKNDFDLAWLHHQHKNPHHWQYWLLQEDDRELIALDMPNEYILEMICDWWAFSWKDHNLKEIFSWYNKNKDIILLSPKTRETVGHILGKLKQSLN